MMEWREEERERERERKRENLGLAWTCACFPFLWRCHFGAWKYNISMWAHTRRSIAVVICWFPQQLPVFITRHLTSISLLSLPFSPPPSTAIPVFPHSRQFVLKESRLYHISNCGWHHLNLRLDTLCCYYAISHAGSEMNTTKHPLRRYNYNSPQCVRLLRFSFNLRCYSWTLPLRCSPFDCIAKIIGPCSLPGVQ